MASGLGPFLMLLIGAVGIGKQGVRRQAIGHVANGQFQLVAGLLKLSGMEIKLAPQQGALRRRRAEFFRLTDSLAGAVEITFERCQLSRLVDSTEFCVGPTGFGEMRTISEEQC